MQTTQNKKIIIAYCYNCGKPIYDKKDIIYGLETKYCSERCHEKVEGVFKNIKRPILYCCYCRKPIYNIDNVIIGTYGDYCSRNCKEKDDEYHDNSF